MASSQLNRRKSPRIEIDLKLESINSNPCDYSIVNLSNTGFFVKTDNNYPVGSKFLVTFKLPTSPMPINTYCQVVWNGFESTSNNAQSGMGLKFINISEFDKKRYDNYILKSFEYLKINSDNHTLLDFANIKEKKLENRVKPAWSYIEDMKAKGYYTYRRPLVGPSENRVSIEDPVTGKIKHMVMMGSNSYLGLSSHPIVEKAVKDCVDKYGTGAASAPNLAGTFDLHRKLERKLAEFKSCEDAIVFTSGYTTNVGTMSALVKSRDLVLLDKLSHASIIDGCMMGKCNFRTFRHSDLNHLEELLNKNRQLYDEIFIVVEGIYSMDGDICPLPEIYKLAKKYDCKIMMDDAHATGVIGKNGRGTANHFDLDGKIDIEIGTLSKALGHFGGFVASTKEVVNYLRHYSRSYFFATSLPPTVIASSLAAIEVMESDDQIFHNLWNNINYFKSRLIGMGFNVVQNTQSAIIPIIVGDESILKKMSIRVHEEGLYINPVPYPAVPIDKTRFRATIMATHTREDLDFALHVLEKVGKESGIIGEKVKIETISQK